MMYGNETLFEDTVIFSFHFIHTLYCWSDGGDDSCRIIARFSWWLWGRCVACSFLTLMTEPFPTDGHCLLCSLPCMRMSESRCIGHIPYSLSLYKAFTGHEITSLFAVIFRKSVSIPFTPCLDFSVPLQFGETQPLSAWVWMNSGMWQGIGNFK